MMMTSLIDRDGWKELTKATIFTPPNPLKKNATWEEPTTHAWGDLGAWNGKAVYKFLGEKEKLQTIGYALQLRYQPPAGPQNNLPFKIQNPMFRIKQAQGVMRFDPKFNRLSILQERFQVQGQLQIQIAGQNLPLRLEETQDFQLELFDKKPPPEKR